jgi:aminopeptidase YwaD
MRTRLGLALLLLACKPAGTVAPPAEPTAPPAAPPNPWTAPPAVPADRLERHLAFLADDAQEGRAPGTAADQRVQQHIEAAFKELGLQPGFGASFVQPFAVTDGVRLIPARPPTSRSARPTSPSSSSPGRTARPPPVEAPLVYIGHGVSDDPKLAAAMKGAIVVARAGAPQDPHLDPTRTRAQNKLIAARDRGAVGFILWDPDSDLPYPNHGEANDLTIPAVAVGKAGTPALLAAFGSKQPATPPTRTPASSPARRPRAKAALHTPVERVVLTTANVGGVLPGAGPRRIVLGAHMDHLGLGTASSLAPGQTAVHNGADDNASGVAAMLALAAALAPGRREHRPYTVQFVAFGAEEMGLLGSKHSSAQLSPSRPPGDRRHAQLRHGRPPAERQRRRVRRRHLERLAEAARARRGRRPEIRPSEDGFGASDQTSFYAAGIPVLHFFSGTHGDYHKPSDDLDKINIPGAAEDRRPHPPPDRPAHAGPAHGSTTSRSPPPPRARRLSRVARHRPRLRRQGRRRPDRRGQEGRPRRRRRAQAGDIITKLGAREIHNFDDYMACFGELQPGAEVPIVIRRGDQTLDLKITPAAPSRR